MKYKVGDTVKIVANKACSMNKIGDIGVLIQIIDTGYQIQVVGGVNLVSWQLETDLELVPPAPKFKVGDTVNIIPGKTDLIRKIGYGGKITAINNGEYHIDIKANGNSIDCWQKEENLELVEVIFPKYEVGDTVKIIANEAESNNKIGDIGVIVEVTLNGAMVEVRGNKDIVNWQLKSDLQLVALTLACTYTREELVKAYELGLSQSNEFDKIFPEN